MPEEAAQTLSIPPKLITRNTFGLIEGLNYVFEENGLINWRKMVKPEFLVPNKQIFEKKNKTIPSSIEGLEDRELLILLGGLKDLAQIRGFSSVKHCVTSPSENYVISTCHITWLPSYETEQIPVTFSAIGDAGPLNTNGYGRNYLGPIAENRAFVRCVRNFLKINIVSQEEIGGAAPVVKNEDASTSQLREAMAQFNVSFETIKAKLIKENVEGAESFTDISQIPMFKRCELFNRIKNKNNS